MNTVDLQNLRELAGAAIEAEKQYLHREVGWQNANGDFRDATNPAAILAILDRLEASEAECRAMRNCPNCKHYKVWIDCPVAKECDNDLSKWEAI